MARPFVRPPGGLLTSWPARSIETGRRTSTGGPRKEERSSAFLFPFRKSCPVSGPALLTWYPAGFLSGSLTLAPSGTRETAYTGGNMHSLPADYRKQARPFTGSQLLRERPIHGIYSRFFDFTVCGPPGGYLAPPSGSCLYARISGHWGYWPPSYVLLNC